METPNEHATPGGRNRQRGFTLAEVLTVMALIALLAAVAIPITTNTMPTKNMRGAARDLYSAMMRAKAEAARLGGKVAVQMNPDGSHFYRIFADNGEGVDDKGKSAAGNGKFEKALGETSILEGSRLPGRVIFLKNKDGNMGWGLSYVTNNDGGHPDNARRVVLFDRRGIPYTPKGEVASGTLILCAAKSPANQYGVGSESDLRGYKAGMGAKALSRLKEDNCRVLVVNEAGRVRTITYAQCVDERDDEGDPACPKTK